MNDSDANWPHAFPVPGLLYNKVNFEQISKNCVYISIAYEGVV